MSVFKENPYAGTGAHSYPVPMAVGQVVEIRDGNHNGTSVWRRDDHFTPYVFASHDTGLCGYSERAILVRGQDVEAIPDVNPYGCDLSTPDGMCIVGIDGTEEDRPWWLSEGAEILWDSALEEEYEAAADAVIDGRAFGNPIEIVRMLRRAKSLPAKPELSLAFFRAYEGKYRESLARGDRPEESPIQQAWALWGGDAMFERLLRDSGEQ